MNLYLKKKQTKTTLFVLAILIIGVSLWYSDAIIKKIRQEERNKVELWSKAIEKKARLVDYTARLFEMLREEEDKKVNHWYEATTLLVGPKEFEDLSFISKIISDNTTIPIIVVDQSENIMATLNLDEGKEDNEDYLKQELAKMKKANQPLPIKISATETQYLYYRDSKVFRELRLVMDDLINSFISETVINAASVPVLITNKDHNELIALGNLDSSTVASPELLLAKTNEMATQNEVIEIDLNGEKRFIYYEDSYLLTQLRYYPLVQLAAIGLFLVISYLLFSTFRNAEQNQVWVGMAKETAHQLGTPLSSLMAWMDVLKERDTDVPLLEELRKDVARLNTVTQRFSKIGSIPELKPVDLIDNLQNTVDYMKLRIPRKVEILTDWSEVEAPLEVPLSAPLFDWVVENLIRNAVDAMEGKGSISLALQRMGNWVYLDISDTGKGIPRSKQRTIFQPGYTTKKRGWGLGLSLTKRIVEKYHKGKIVVRQSDSKGTSFRISLKVG